MSGTIRSSVLLLGALMMGLAAEAQQVPPQTTKPTTADIAITFVAERAKIASVDCGCFWLQGGSFSGAITFFHGLGVAANLSGVHAADITSGVDLDKVSFMMGPRYTYRPEHWEEPVLRSESWNRNLWRGVIRRCSRVQYGNSFLVRSAGCGKLSCDPGGRWNGLDDGQRHRGTCRGSGLCPFHLTE